MDVEYNAKNNLTDWLTDWYTQHELSLLDVHCTAFQLGSDCLAADAGKLAIASARANVNQRARIAAVAARCRPARSGPSLDRTARRLGSNPGYQLRRSPPAAVVPRRPCSGRPAAAPRCWARLKRQRETDVRQVRYDVIDATVGQLYFLLCLQLTIKRAIICSFVHVILTPDCNWTTRTVLWLDCDL